MAALQALAVVHLGLSVEEFMRLTPYEFNLMLHLRARAREQEVQIKRHDYELARLLVLPLINIHLKKGDRINDPKKLIRFGWEAEGQQVDLSDFDPDYHLQQFL